MPLNLFHTTVKNWFISAFGEPTEVQKKSWPSVKSGRNTLIAAPTGSGKTLAAFLSAIDDLIKQGFEGTLKQETQILYVSPLKALSNDIEKNLRLPLKGIKDEILKEYNKEIIIDVAVRTGDTTASARNAILKRPPHIIVTTPESLYLLLTSDNGRRLLTTVNTLIVDEIHAVVGNKRGVHLSLSLERLENLVTNSLTRIGLSATQKPIEKVAEFLFGAKSTGYNIIDTGHKRELDLDLILPYTPLDSIMSNEVWTEIHGRLTELINSHKTTLIFVNNRRLAERLTHQLSLIVGKDKVTSHHGSMSKEHRELAEKKLKEGLLKALVATSSLELGIDIGSVDLVCQISSPRSISAFLQRVGRSGHSVNGLPKGRLFPLTRNDLLECVAILFAVKKGEIDNIIIPEKPLDVLTQQIVAEVSCKEYDKDELYNVIHKSYPYRNLEYAEYESIIKMLSEGYSGKRGRKNAFVHYDIINKKLRPGKAARLTALVSGGTIPDNFDYDVILDPEGTLIGTVNEDFAVESIPGDIFQLGNNSWKIRKIENGKVRVEDAGNTPPNMPFWIGEAPGRTDELSILVSWVVEEIDKKIIIDNTENIDLKIDEHLINNALEWLKININLNEDAAKQLVMYLAISKINLGNLPSVNRFIIERFFDRAGDMHIVIHSLLGNRMNRAWGLALRKRFCRKFNFELQAAANENAIVLSLGTTHSFPLNEVFSYLNSNTVRNVLTQALLDSPMFEIRWRWNASTALAVIRRRAGKRVPPQLQRIQSEDLISLVFPDQLACLENISGDRQVPDHPLVTQTINDCLFVAMDIEKLEYIIENIRKNKIETLSKDTTEPSPLAHEILVAQPYAFLDNAPAEERRVQAVMNNRWRELNNTKDLGRLDENAIRKVKEEAWPIARSADELYDVLMLSGFITEHEGKINLEEFQQLQNDYRATTIVINNKKIWVAAERIPEFIQAFTSAKADPWIPVPEEIEKSAQNITDPVKEIIRGRLEISGPVTSDQISKSLDVDKTIIEQALLALEVEGFALRGKFSNKVNSEQWCERRLLSRIHRYTVENLRQSVKPVSQVDYMRFLFRWHNMLPDTKPEGQSSMQKVLDQLEGFEAQSIAWEGDILPARIKDYNHTWLDFLFFTGNFIWGRFNEKNRMTALNPVRSTPVSIIKRTDLEVFSLINKDEPLYTLSRNAKIILNLLEEEGSLFFDQLHEKTIFLMPVQVEDALSELVVKGLVSSDSFTGLRALLIPDKYKNKRRAQNGITFDFSQAGRWWKINKVNISEDLLKKEKNIEKLALFLLKRYGVVFRKLVEKEKLLPVWRDLLKQYRKMESRGDIRGGRFIEGLWGEQFALPSAVVSLRSVQKEKSDDEYIAISACDPLNLTGILTSGRKIPSISSNRILYKNGIPVLIKEGKELTFTRNYDEKEKWHLQNILIKRNIQHELKPYLIY